MEISFKNEAEKKEFQNNIVNILTGLDIHVKEHEANKIFLKGLYYSSK